jgi:uncharacterized protein
MYDFHDPPIASISLRAGGALDIWPDRIVANGRTYPLAELNGAALAADPLAPAGTRAGPAIALRGRDSGWDTYVPMDPPDAQRGLNAIYERRPDLRAASKVGAGAAVATRGGPAGAPSHDQAVLAGIAHLSFFFAPFLLPLIIWLATRSTSPYASHQAKQAFFFHLSIAVATCFIGIALAAIFVVTLLLGVSWNNAGFAVPGLFAFPIGIILVIALFLISCVYSIYAAVQAFSGRPFTYPLLRRL